MKYFLILIASIALIACEAESVDDLRPVVEETPVVNPNDTTVTDTTGTDTTGTGGGPTVFFARDIKPLIKTNCATPNCHASFENFPTLETYSQINQNKERVNTRVQAGTMPQSGPLPQREKDLIQTWINEGALDN
jgi:hypothetical protein